MTTLPSEKSWRRGKSNPEAIAKRIADWEEIAGSETSPPQSKSSGRAATDGSSKPKSSQAKSPGKKRKKAKPAAVPAKSEVPQSPGKSAHDKVDHFGFYAKGERELDEVMRPVDACLAENGKWPVLIALREELRNADRAILLTQIFYWMSYSKENRVRRAKARWHGRRYLAKTHKELADETGMPERQVTACLAWLKTHGWIQVEAHHFGKHHQRHNKSHIRPLRVPRLIHSAQQ